MSEWFVVVECLDRTLADRWQRWRHPDITHLDSPMYVPKNCSEARAREVVAYMQPTVIKGSRWRFHAMSREELDAKLVENELVRSCR